MSAESAHTTLRSGPRRYADAPRRGEERRAKLLDALEKLLEELPLAKISTNDIARAAGVTRSAFHYYFPTKGSAVTALVEDIYRELFEATGTWHSAEGSASVELRAGFDSLMAYTRSHPTLFVAMFDAVGSDADVRELWEQELDHLTDRVAAKIIEERATGRAPAGGDASSIASALVAMNERALEREARAIAAGGTPSDALTDALFEIWQRTIYRP